MKESTATSTGGCLCGAVRYEVRGSLRPIVVCHCGQCRRATGHVMAATAARRSAFRLVSGEELRWYASSAAARRGFCGRCGSTLFWEGAGRDYLSIAAGSLDDPGQLGVGYHIFVADKVPYDAIGDSAPRSADGTFAVDWS